MMFSKSLLISLLRHLFRRKRLNLECTATNLMILKALKLLNHSKGKLKDGMIVATAGYVENSLARSGS